MTLAVLLPVVITLAEMILAAIIRAVMIPAEVTLEVIPGTISGNTARTYGGGVYLNWHDSSFRKFSGTITGYDSDPVNGNAVRDSSGVVQSYKGHAVYYYNGSKRKETTAGPDLGTSSYNNDF